MPPKDPIKYELWRQRNSESKKGHGFTKETLLKMSNAKKGKNHPNFGKPRSETTRKKISDANKGQRPWMKGKPSPMKGKHHTEKTLLKMKESHKNPQPISETTRKKLSDAQKGKHHSEATKQKLRNINMGNQLSESTKKKVSDALKGKNHPNWKGGASFLPYCEKFNKNLKERVRAFFNYTCQLCGTPQNGKKLAVHHVKYNKHTCCDETKPLFIPLCPTGCHAKTNYNREYWDNHFTELIEGYYEGKCFFTQEEMNKLYGNPY